MQPDGVFVKLAAGIQVNHVKHDMAASDDIERRIEDVRRHRHVASLVKTRSRFTPSLRGALATKQSIFGYQEDGLLRFARNDGKSSDTFSFQDKDIPQAAARSRLA
jgi:hypothetical protein